MITWARTGDKENSWTIYANNEHSFKYDVLTDELNSEYTSIHLSCFLLTYRIAIKVEQKQTLKLKEIFIAT